MRRQWPVLGCAVLLCLLLGCVRTRIGAGTGERAGRGEAPSEATLSIGGRTYQVAGCSSGGREYFLGVDLLDQSGHMIVRVLVDPMYGPRLRLAAATGCSGQAVLLLDSSSCRQLEARVEPTGWRVNRVRDFSGFLDVDCTTADGCEVRGQVRFTHCH